MADNTTIIFNQVAKTGTFGSVIDAVNSNFDLAKIAILNMKGKSAYEIWVSQEGNENKTLDDFWRYLTADKGYEKITLASVSNRPSPGEANLNAVYVYPDPDNDSKSITAASNGTIWIELFKSDGNIKQMGDDIEELKKDAIKVHYFGKDYYKEFDSGEVPISAVESFGFGGKTGDMLQIVVNATGYVSGQKFLELYGKATSNAEWVAISGCSWYAALDRRVTLGNDYAEIGFKLGSTVDEAEVKASLLDEKAALSDISAKIEGYYTCSSSAQNDKTIDAKWFRLRNGSKIIVKFTYSNTKPTPVTLNINGTGAKNIYINGKQAGLDNTWKKGSVCLCWYDANEQHYNLKVLFDNDGDLSESVGIINDLYLKSSDWEDITNSVDLTTGFKYNVSTSSGIAIGSTQESNSYAYTEPIPLNKGEAIRVKSYGNLFCPIQESNENGNILARLVVCSSDASAYREFSYIATRDMYVVVNVFTTNGNYPYNISKGVGLQTLIDILEMSKTLCNGYVQRDAVMFTTNDVSAGDVLYYQVRPNTAGFAIRLRYMDDETEKNLDIVSNPQAEAGKDYYGSFVMPDIDFIRAYNPWSSGNVIIAKEGTLAADSIKLKLNDDILNDVVFKGQQVSSKRIFDLDDVSVGETIYFKIKPVGNSFVLKFYDENNTWLNRDKGPAQYNQTAEAGKEYIGKAIIPENFSYAKIEWGTCDVTIAKKGTIAGDSVVLSMMEDDVAAMKGGGTLPIYYKDYLDGKEIEIRNLQLDIQGEEDSFIFITDSHWSDNYKQSPAIIESILKRGLTNKVVFGGDLMAENTDGTIEDVKAQVNFHRKFASTVQSCASMFFNIRGNHDINGKNTGDAEKWRPTEKATENVLMQPTEVFNRIKNVNGLDYVFDNDIKKIRYIIFDGLEATAWKNYNGNVPYSGDPILLSNVNQRKAKFDIKIPSGYTEGNTAVKLYIGTDNNGVTEWQYQNSLDINSINGEQVRDLGMGSVGKKLGFLFGGNYTSARLTLTLTSLDGSNGKLETTLNWLKDALISTPANYDILVFSHYAAIAATGSSYVPDIFRIVNAYNNKANVTINSTPCDFSNVQGKVLAYISGHTHKNLQSFSAGVTHICTACDARYSENPYMNEKPYSRAQGTVSEQLFDFIQIDKYANMIYCKRIGAGYDRYFHTEPNSIANGNSITLQSSMLSGELTWGCYDNDKAVTKTDSAQITETKVSVSNGVVSGIAIGEAVVYAMDATGNREFFEVIVG